ncbi:hypothetical protein SPRG_14905 [Saprolegnia parasitica CBS 223.65]|uniref:Uncharacterized protein n=1 Tax=Saprolegnia parasitica (strain CBS 223.65) TaxID=695850 RepID=A0A067BN05_SAPPC|nr:hypothetical protein SPRG_14905 [Saprolegnia parasitica CBS 223.65]KDO19874.1 hypothetical protein SPRG_14905 [Saprolegnia parasitica CBS 223.65]|eukprot:XP_012209431.1 hypothetical protein SPRG_14905 [Saprolegnia parasitica CBS 223.65]
MESPPRSVSPPHISRSRSVRSSVTSAPTRDLLRTDCGEARPRYMQETTSSIQKYGPADEESPPKMLCHPPGNPMLMSRRSPKLDFRPEPVTRRPSNSSPPKTADLERQLEEMTMHYHQLQATLADKDAIISTFTQTCTRLQADCELLAESAASWKARYEALSARDHEVPSPSTATDEAVLELRSILLVEADDAPAKKATPS